MDAVPVTFKEFAFLGRGLKSLCLKASVAVVAASQRKVYSEAWELLITHLKTAPLGR